MARIFVLMSLLFATISHAAQWRVYNPESGSIENAFQTYSFYTKAHIEYPSSWCKEIKVTGTETASGASITGTPEISGGKCRLFYPNENGMGSVTLNVQHKVVGCLDSSRPQSYADSSCKPFDQIQCPANQTIDPITGECNCSDGFIDDGTYNCAENEPDDGTGGDGTGGDGTGGDGTGGDGSGSDSNYECDSSESCLTEAQGICSADNRTVMEFQYQGAGYYQYTCGYEDYNCGNGFSWDRANQVCKADQDQDGTPDDQDPEPQNPDENGDRDGDGVPDGQDSHPDDPEQWNGNPQSNHNGQNVNPIGESDSFNDSAIVEALNQNTQTTNTTNSKLDALYEQGALSNDQLAQINDGLQGLSDTLGQEEPTGKGSGDLNDAVGEALDDFEQMTIDEFNKGIDDNLLVEQGDIPTIETAFGGLELEKCEDITNDLFTLELCSLAPRINPILYWAFACFTVIACFQNVSATLKKENR
jgi:hypothetical protein